MFRPSSPTTTVCPSRPTTVVCPSSPTTVITNYLQFPFAPTKIKIRRSIIINTTDTNTARRCLLIKKNVTFAPIHMLNTVVTDTYLSHRDMTYEEKQTTWIQTHEALLIKYQCKRLLMDVEKFGTEDLYDNETGEKICLRGLESCLKIHALQKKQNRMEARHEVFCEQEDQYTRGLFGNNGCYYDDEAIAAAYQSKTIDCQTQAEWKANLDRYEIEDYLKE